MHILITGATGFIAAHIVTGLLAAGHTVTCCLRNISYGKRIFPKCSIIPCDFAHDTSPNIWLPRLQGIDVVINCVGIFYHPNKKVIWAIHHDTPRALFTAAVTARVKKIIQISALGVENADVAYAKSKKAADDYLLSLPLPVIVLRPSFVYGQGSYGGSSLFRGLAGLPWIIPVPGKGQQKLQPIHVQDLTRAVIKLLNDNEIHSKIFTAVGPKQIYLQDLLNILRDWLGLAKAKILHVPLFFMRLGACFGNFIPYSTLNSTAYQMLNQDNIASDADSKAFFEAVGFTPRDFEQGIYSNPSTVQDRWHAHLFFLKPALQLSIAFIWLFTAIVSLIYPRELSYELLQSIGVSETWQPILFFGATFLNACVGLAVLFNFQIKKVGILQILIVLIYTAIISITLPALWLAPFAPIAKNIPFIMTILVYLALESDR